MKKLETSKSDFKIFKTETLKWLARYGLNRYDVVITHRKLKGKRAVAECWFDHLGMVARISLGKDWSIQADGITEEEIKLSAEHEVIELLLSKLCSLINLERFVREDEIDEERHAIINAIINSKK